MTYQACVAAIHKKNLEKSKQRQNLFEKSVWLESTAHIKGATIKY